MASPVRNVAARYIEALPDSSPMRSPLGQTNKLNIGSPKKQEKRGKLASPDLDDLARQMNIETPKKTDFLRAKFETPSATVSSFKTTPSARASASASKPEPSRISTLNVPLENASPSKTRNSPGSADSKAYEYLCRIQAIRNWLQAVLQEEIPQSAAELISHVRNGIYLAKLANVFLPQKKQVYLQDARLEFRHTENINRFFRLVKHLEIPGVFQFELTDLYDAKDVPKVWFCLHAIIYKINASNPEFPAVENLVGKLEFTAEDLKIAARALLGHQLPNFASADNNHTGSPGSAYMNKTLSVASPGRSPLRSPAKSPVKDQNRAPETENPFLEKTARLSPATHAPSYKLNSVKTPDLSVGRAQDDAICETPIQLHELDTSHSYYTPELESQMVNIVKLQALCKGAAFRYTMFVRKIMVRSYDTEFTELFSKIRGNAARSKTVHRHRGEVLLHEREILQLQATARMRLAQRAGKRDLVSAEAKAVERLQSLARGFVVRNAVKKDLQKLAECAGQITQLQCRIRAKAIYRNVSVVSQHRPTIEASIIELQSHARRALYQSEKNRSIVSHLKSDAGIVELQSLIRGAHARNEVRKRLRVLFRQSANLCELQNIARGAITRTRLCNNVLITLLGEDIKMNDLFAKARGNFVRARVSLRQEAVQAESAHITRLQSAFRGILVRFHQSVDIEDIYENVGPLIRLQAKIRARTVRTEIAEMKQYYSGRVDKVVRAQAVLRSKYTQNAYKAFTLMENPPVDVVRRFAYLLSDSGTDFEEELELTRLKDEIVEKSKSNEDLETQIESLDIKLGLLDKNKITVEDFVKNQHKHKMYRPAVQGQGTSRSLEGLGKSAKQRVELYSSMFYFLQTSPAYWLRLYEIMSPQDPDRPLKNLHSQVSSLFSLARCGVHANSREEFFFVKLVCAVMGSDMKTRCRNVADITKMSSAFWITYLLELNSQTQQRTHLKRLFGKAVEKVIDDDVISFESNPTRIHELVRAQEINVHGRSDRPKSVTPQIAIKDEDVSAQFVHNLMALRDAASEVLDCLRANVAQLPVHVRIAAKEAFKLSQARFPENSNQSHLSVAGVIVIKHYVSNIMQNPGHFGYSTQDPIAASGVNPTRTADNLKYLGRVLLQVFSMKAFSDNFMKPLNEFVVAHVPATKAIVREIIDVRDIEAEYEMNDYDDLVSHDRPQLTMRASDMIALEKLVSRNLEIVVPGIDDQLYPIVTELNELANSANDYVTLTEMGSLTLSLYPASHESSAADSKKKTLLAQAKRCLLYIMQVQDGNELLELFVRGIKPAHEAKFREIVAAEIHEARENSAKRGGRQNSSPYAQSSLGDLSAMSYVSLKKMALKVILELESLGVVTRTDSFQELLNQVVSDIRTKDTRRTTRKSELVLATQTVAKLGEKEMFLKRQLNDYNRHIDRMLTDLQTRPKEKKLFNVIPVFSKQYFYHRQLKKHNRLPKFGSYKYSAKKLMEQGVVYDIGGSLYRKGATSSKVEFMFSCHKAGVFVIEAANGAITIPGACNTVTLDQVLDQQYAHNKTWVMFDGMVTFETEALASLIFKSFYDIRRD